MTFGTCYFSSVLWAEWYYRRQGYSLADVAEKLEMGEIKIGKPPLRKGETCFLDSDGRYHVREAKK